MIAREELRALRDADTLHRLPKEALVASVQDLASASLDLAEAVSKSNALLAEAAEVLREIQGTVWEFERAGSRGQMIGFREIVRLWEHRAKPLLDKLGERE